MKTIEQLTLCMYLRTRLDFQELRKSMDNRLKRKADGKPQKNDGSINFLTKDRINFDMISRRAKEQEDEIQKMLKGALKVFPVYTEWMKEVKGIGEIAAAWLIGEIDIHEATTISKIWQYAGLNPGLIKGKKRISKSSYKEGMGKIISAIPNIKTGEMDLIIETDDLIRGDRPAELYILPYNKNLKSYLLGVMAEGFIKAQNSYVFDYYYPYKYRLENENRNIRNLGKTRKDDGKLWKDVSKGHRDRAAKRYMIKMFLKDLYVNWREIEGLPVRKPYAEEYLDKIHA